MSLTDEEVRILSDFEAYPATSGYRRTDMRTGVRYNTNAEEPTLTVTDTTGEPLVTDISNTSNETTYTWGTIGEPPTKRSLKEMEIMMEEIQRMADQYDKQQKKQRDEIELKWKRKFNKSIITIL